jgi:ATP-dependent DNA helicase RecG
MARQARLVIQPPNDAIPQTWTPDDIYDKASEEVIQGFTEDHRVERKPARFDPRQLGDYFSIFANRAPHGGVIFLGVADNGEIEGCAQLDNKRLDEMEQAGRTYCPDARYDYKRVPIYKKDGKADFIIAFRVAYRADRLVESVRGEAFTRIGGSKKKLSELEKREIRINKREIDFESEDAALTWPGDFDFDLVHAYSTSFLSRRRLSLQKSVREILVLSHLGRMSDAATFTPNIASALLFAKDPRRLFPGSRIRFLKFDGRAELTGSQRNEIADEWIDGPIPHLIARAESIILDHLDGPNRLNKDGRFAKDTKYPKDAWLEAIVNACVHRSYNLRNMPIFVRMFDDKITIESPGGFPPPTTARTVYDSHNPRNPFIMEALYYLDFVKCAHEGARRMRDLMAEAGLPDPQFSEVDLDGYLVRVTLRSETAESSRLLATVDRESSDDKIVAYLRAHKSISVTEAEKLLGVGWRTAKKTLEGLEQKGICERRSSSNKSRDPKARYYLAKR